VLIIPFNTKDALSAFFGRDRKMEIKTFFETHIKSKQTIAKILQEMGTRIEIYGSFYKDRSRGKLSFQRILLSDTGGRKGMATILLHLADDDSRLAQKLGIVI
jgi:hypothetical protein